MHYEASQVSQYSSGGTPNLKPTARAPPLPLEDDPLQLTPLSSHAQAYHDNKDSSTVTNSQPEVRVASLHNNVLVPIRKNTVSHRSLHSRTASLGVVTEGDVVSSWDAETTSDRDLKDDASSTTTSRFRRLLSGEIRSVDLDDIAPPVEQEEEASASPVSVAHEAAATALKQQQKKESGRAEQRRVREAIQFAEAVGECLSISRDELRIIEDHTDDGESDDDDGDVCKFKEIVVSSPGTMQDPVNITKITLDTANSSANVQDAQEGNAIALPAPVDVPPRKSKRPQWPFGPSESDYDRFLDHLSDESSRNSFVYKGISANPPEITQRGIQRGNYAQLHRKAWLEVSDKYHRYGKNLRLYYRYWERLGFPTNQFFDWLDSKGEAAGHPLPNLEECPRSILDSDTVLYISKPEITEGYALDIVCNEEGRGKFIDVDGSPIITGQEGWIFVLRDNVMYGA